MLRALFGPEGLHNAAILPWIAVGVKPVRETE
jgi:hypothetical protein